MAILSTAPAPALNSFRVAGSRAPPHRLGGRGHPRWWQGQGLALFFGQFQLGLAQVAEATDGGHEFTLGRQVGRLHRLDHIAFEQHHHVAPLHVGIGPAQRKDVVPAVGMEGVGQQRRAQHVTHLQACQSGLDERRLFLSDGVALHDVDAVGRDEAQKAVGALQRFAASERQRSHQGTGGGATKGRGWAHGRRGRTGGVGAAPRRGAGRATRACPGDYDRPILAGRPIRLRAGATGAGGAIEARR